MDYVVEDGVFFRMRFFFIVRCVRLLFAYDIEEDTLKIIDVLPEGDFYDITDGIRLFLWDDRIIFTPMGSKAIWSYDLKNRTWEKKEFGIKGSCGLDMQLYVSYLEKGLMMMVGCHTPAVVYYDTEEGSYYIIETSSFLNKNIPFFDRNRFVLDEDRLLIPLSDNSGMIQVLFSKTVELKKTERNVIEAELEKKYESGNVGRYIIGNDIVCQKEEGTIWLYERGDCVINSNNLQMNSRTIDCNAIKNTVLGYIHNNNIGRPKWFDGIIIEQKNFGIEDYLFFTGL